VVDWCRRIWTQDQIRIVLLYYMFTYSAWQHGNALAAHSMGVYRENQLLWDGSIDALIE